MNWMRHGPSVHAKFDTLGSMHSWRFFWVAAEAATLLISSILQRNFREASFPSVLHLNMRLQTLVEVSILFMTLNSYGTNGFLALNFFLIPLAVWQAFH